MDPAKAQTGRNMRENAQQGLEIRRFVIYFFLPLSFADRACIVFSDGGDRARQSPPIDAQPTPFDPNAVARPEKLSAAGFVGL